MIDILAQIGSVVLVRLAAKNAILIVEFARQRQDREDDEPEESRDCSCTNASSSNPDDMLCF